MKQGNRYGTHRVLEPKGILPQPAIKIDNDMEIYDNEILIDVDTLNIDSASFTQIYNQAEKDLDKTKEIIMDIVATRGKHQNPVTGSGGMLLGTVEKIGPALEGKTDLKVGDKIATLVSLSLTPLRIDEIVAINPEIDRVEIKGKAILFESGIYSIVPDDLPENLVLSVLDVCGAPAQTAKIAKLGQTVMVIGGPGKAGMLCLYEAKRRVGVTGKVICVNYDETRFKEIQEMGIADVCIAADATDAVGLLEKVEEVTGGELCDVVINCVNVENTEMASILCTKDDGLVYFFSMATSFTKAALGAEGVGKDVNMMIGNGYTKGHAELTLQIMRDSEDLRNLYTQLFV
ncbi:MAG: zinc-binding dehydrogenase [Tissierellia bacterium]|nr:zinc-binding dehydrogenase [Tissierellia bacterium]